MGKGKRDNKDDKSTASLNKKLDDLNARFDRNLLELEKWKKNKKRIDRDIDRVKSDISKSKNELDEMVESKNNHEDIGNVLLMKNKKNSNVIFGNFSYGLGGVGGVAFGRKFLCLEKQWEFAAEGRGFDWRNHFTVFWCCYWQEQRKKDCWYCFISVISFFNCLMPNFKSFIDQHNDSDTGSDGSGVEIKSKSKKQTKAK